MLTRIEELNLQYCSNAQWGGLRGARGGQWHRACQNVPDCLSRDPMTVLHPGSITPEPMKRCCFRRTGQRMPGALCEKYFASMRIRSSILRSEVGSVPSSPLNFQESLCRSADRSCGVETTKNARPCDRLNPVALLFAVRILRRRFAVPHADFMNAGCV